MTTSQSQPPAKISWWRRFLKNFKQGYSEGTDKSLARLDQVHPGTSYLYNRIFKRKD